MTRAPSSRRSRRCCGHRADEDGPRLAIEQFPVTGDEFGSRGLHEFAHERGDENGVLWQGAHAHVGGQRREDRVELLRVAAIGKHGGDMGVIEFKFGTPLLGNLGDLRGSAVDTVHHKRNGSAKIRGDPGVEFKFRCAGNIRVVRANDHHGIAAPRHIVIPRNDGRERRFSV